MVLFVWHTPMVLPLVGDWGQDSPTNVCDVACNLLTGWDTGTGQGAVRDDADDVFTV